jgi:prepilin-type N-terminal cleavage/methylation domain-containing protein
MSMENKKKRMGGFTLVECVVVVALAAVMMGMAIVNASHSLEESKATSAATAVLSQMRLARMLAISQRRNVAVTFVTRSNNPQRLEQVDIQVVALPGEPEYAVQSVPLPAGTQFVLEPGVPDTPMNLGNGSAVYFSGRYRRSMVMQFTPSGSFLDENADVLNGTIFVGVPEVPGTARAVTVMGGAGHSQLFTWNGSQWM